jgi:mono/diheme cytochrome c family protein
MKRARFCLASLLWLAACQDPTGPESDISGERLYNQYCARCHGIDGAGVAEQPATLKRLDNVQVMRVLSDEHIMGTIRAGKPPAMPGFGDQFTEAKLMVLVAYVRSLSGTKGAHDPDAS